MRRFPWAIAALPVVVASAAFAAPDTPPQQKNLATFSVTGMT
jgi:hypothetical protein